jgi:hypothetical protein
LNANGVSQSAYPAEFPLSDTNLVATWNAEQHGLVNLAGHGNESGIYQYQWNTDIDNDDTINEPTRPLDTGDEQIRSRNELDQRTFLKSADVGWLHPPAESAPVVAAAGCGVANAEHGNGLGVTLMGQGKAAAFFGSVGTTGYEPAWTTNTGKGMMQDILLRFNQQLLGAYPRIGDAAFQTTMQLFDETPGEPRGRALVKHVLYGDPAMNYWGGAAEFDSPWPMFRHDIRNSGLTSYTGPALGAVRWTFQLNPGPFTNGVPSPIVGPDGTIYAGNANGILYAINPDGTEKWHIQTGGTINAAPILTVDGTLYFRAEDGYLYAVAASDGRQRWREPIEQVPGTAGPTPTYPPFSNSPRVMPDGTVIVLATISGGDHVNGVYNGYRPTGARRWTLQYDQGAIGTPAITGDSLAYFSLWNGFLNTGFNLGAR